MLMLTKTGFGIAQNASGIRTDELLEQIDVFFVKNEVFVPTDGTRIARANMAAAYTSFTGFSGRDAAFVVAAIQHLHRLFFFLVKIERVSIVF